MNYKPFIKLIRSITIVSAWLQIITLPLYGDVAAVVTVTGSRVIPNYFNGTNTLTVTVTFTGDELTTYANGYVLVHTGWAENGSTPDSDAAFPGVDWQGRVNGSGVATITRTANQLQTYRSATNTPHGDHFDIRIQIKDSGLSNVAWVDASLDNSYLNDWGDAGTNNYLTFDADSPGFTTLTGNFYSSDYFNSTI